MDIYRQYFHVFGEQRNRDLLSLAFSKREHFSQSKTSPAKLYPDWRRSKVVYDDQLVEVAGALEHEIRARLPEVMASLEIPNFEIGSFEIQLTSHNDSEYYKWHTDSGTPNTASRVITFVYYFHLTPRRFTGGELSIYRSTGEVVTVDPENDSLVFFNSRTKHEVNVVKCSSGRFEDGRFTLNGWIRRRVFHRSDTYFDSKIFSSPTRVGTQRERYGATVLGAIGSSTSEAASTRHVRTDEEVLFRLDELQIGSHSMASLLNLYSKLYGQSRQARKIDVVHDLSSADFYEKYYFSNRPVLLKGLASNSVAVRTWSPMFFKENYGTIPVQITNNRNQIAEYEASFPQTRETITIAAFVERLLRERETNNFYLVARNAFFEHPALRPLKQDLQPPSEIIDTADVRPGTVKLWFGPKGTVTPLHYDEHSILFMQIQGRKRFKLVPSFDLFKIYPRKRFYSAVDPENPDLERYPLFREASLAEVEVESGDFLFLPVGWWHWAKSLDISISATFCSFHVLGRNTTLRLPKM